MMMSLLPVVVTKMSTWSSTSRIGATCGTKRDACRQQYCQNPAHGSGVALWKGCCAVNRLLRCEQAAAQLRRRRVSRLADRCSKPARGCDSRTAQLSHIAQLQAPAGLN